MFATFPSVIAAVNELKGLGLITDYAIGGAVAQIVWDEAFFTRDLDVLVLLAPGGNPLDPLQPIHQWAKERGYPLREEHIMISGVPVQFMPSYNPLIEEAIREAKTANLSGEAARVVRPEFLIAIWLQPPADTLRRRERVAKLRESVPLDSKLLEDLLGRYNLR